LRVVPETSGQDLELPSYFKVAEGTPMTEDLDLDDWVEEAPNHADGDAWFANLIFWRPSFSPKFAP